MTPSPATDRPLLDVLRLLASVGVVRHHMRGDALFGVEFSLLLFLVIMFGLACSSRKREGVPSFVRRKAAFLLAPWVRWSLVYVAVLAAADLVLGAPPGDRFGWEMLAYGGHPALWFLPFAVVALAVAKFLQHLLARRPPLRAATGTCLAACVTTLLVGLLRDLPMPELPHRTWLSRSPAILWGLSLGLTLRVDDTRVRRELLCLNALLPLFSLALATALQLDALATFVRGFAVAVPLACLGFGLMLPVPSPVRSLAGLTFGIYLLHPLVGKTLVQVFDVFSWPASVHAGVAWGLSAGVVWLLSRTPLRWVELRVQGPDRGRARDRRIGTQCPALDARRWTGTGTGVRT